MGYWGVRAFRTTFSIASAAALLVAVAVAGARPDPAAAPDAAVANHELPRHQLLGDWRVARDGRIRFSERRGTVSGRAIGRVRLGGCRLPSRTVLFRRYEFVRRELGADVWRGRAALPRPGCRGVRHVRSTIVVQNDLRIEETSRPGGGPARRLIRIRPRARSGDPVLGTWERNRAGVVVQRRGREYVGTAREAFLIANGCEIPAGTRVWRLRPSAPGRYDGETETFMPPPVCGPGESSRSRWRLERGGSKLLRDAPDGSVVEYERSR